ncbi:MAG: hypothetical protein II374_02650 [Lachnospiraceae bacterium]|nr:hypothetical protein [Lachnospiraceae bacterium]MBQ2320222.1 hypothetical protein [Lachnospiraceae bacterium]
MSRKTRRNNKKNMEEKTMTTPITAPLRQFEIKEEKEVKKEEVKKELFIQYDQLEVNDKVLFEAAINDYCNVSGQAKESVESVNLYVKPQEGKAYYVINGDSEKNGAIDL